jgi:hypothetical protein
VQISLLVITNQCGNPCQMRNNMNLSPWAVLYFHVLCLTLGICRDASASADFKRAVVVLPKVAGGGINGNITFDEDISSSAVSVSFQLNGMNASVRYKVSVYPLAEKPLAAAVPSNDLAVVGFNANHLYLLFNGTMPQGIVAPIDSTFSLTKRDNHSIVGRSVIVEACPNLFVSPNTQDDDVCTAVSTGVVGLSLGLRNIAGGSSEIHDFYPIDKAVCFFTGTSAHPDVEGVMLISHQNRGVPGHEVFVQLSNVAGGSHALKIQKFADLSSNSLGEVYGNVNSKHGIPCAPGRRFGDLGNIQGSNGGGNAKYRGAFREPVSFADLVGRSCAIYSKPDVICESWDSGCVEYSQNQHLVARGVIGMASELHPSVIEATEQIASVDYDCTSFSAPYGRGKLIPTTNESSLSGLVEIFGSERSNGEISIRIQLDGHSPGTTASSRYGIGILQHGDYRGASDLARFNPTLPNNFHGRPPFLMRMVGDLGNIQSAKVVNGSCLHFLSFPQGETASVSLRDSVKSIIGRMFVVYESHDDGSQPNGRVGNPMLWGVIGVGTPPRQSNPNENGEVRNSAMGAALGAGTEAICQLENATLGIKGRVEMRLSRSTGSDSAAFEADAFFSGIERYATYQTLLYSKCDDRGGSFLGGPIVPDSLQSATSCNQNKGVGATEVGSFGVFQSRSANIMTRFKESIPYSGLGHLVGKACVLVKHSDASSIIVAHGTVGIASSLVPDRSEAEKDREESWLLSAIDRNCRINDNTTETVNFFGGGGQGKSRNGNLDSIAIAIIVITLSFGALGSYAGYKHKKRMDVEGPGAALTLDDYPPPPPMPLAMVIPYGDTLPRHPSKKHLHATDSYYNPKKLDAHRSIRHMHLESAKSLKSMKSFASTKNIRSKRTLSSVDKHGRTVLHLTSIDGEERKIAIGPPPRQGGPLPSHPSGLNVTGAGENNSESTEVNNDLGDSNDAVEAFVGWDQIEMGVSRSSTAAGSQINFSEQNQGVELTNLIQTPTTSKSAR